MPSEMRTRQLVGSTFVVTHLIDEHSAGVRVDRFVKMHYRQFSRNQIQNYIDEGRIELRPHGHPKRLKPSTLLQCGDTVVVKTNPGREPKVETKFQIIHEDEELLVVNKPGNLPVHPAGKFLFNTLLMELRKQRPEWMAKGHDFYLVHRLDRETSGVLLLAKKAADAARLVDLFRTRKTVKHYYAIAEGHFPEKEFSVDLELGKDLESHIRLKMRAFEKGSGQLPSLTKFKVLKETPNYTLLDCELLTGRQHQIRVHLSALGRPVVGDKLYSKDAKRFDVYLESRDKSLDVLSDILPMKRHALHSRYLKFFDDKKQSWAQYECDLPEDMKELLEKDEL